MSTSEPGQPDSVQAKIGAFLQCRMHSRPGSEYVGVRRRAAFALLAHLPVSTAILVKFSSAVESGDSVTFSLVHRKKPMHFTTNAPLAVRAWHDWDAMRGRRAASIWFYDSGSPVGWCENLTTRALTQALAHLSNSTGIDLTMQDFYDHPQQYHSQRSKK